MFIDQQQIVWLFEVVIAIENGSQIIRLVK
jgi:hypothetical protein